MKTQKIIRPWLTPTGVEIDTPRLKEICKSWSSETWAQYLYWYEAPRRESLLHTALFQQKCEEMPESIFGQVEQDEGDEYMERCERLLATLPPQEEAVLRLTYLSGRTQREIGATMGLSQPRVHQLKKRALAWLARGLVGEKVFTRRFMKGEIFAREEAVEKLLSESFWKEPPFVAAQSPEQFDPNGHVAVFEKVARHSLRLALQSLAEDEQRLVYLRFWCGRSANATAHALGWGVNVVEQVSDASLSRLTRKIVEIETGYAPGEAPYGY